MICPQCQFQQKIEGGKYCNNCGAPLSTQYSAPKKTGKRYAWAIGCLVLVGAFFFGFLLLLIASNPDRQSPSAEPASIGSPTPNTSPTPIWSELMVTKSVWQEGGLGVVSIWKVTFRNDSNKPIGNIQYRTAYYSETGTLVDKGGVDSPLDKKIIQKVIPAKSTRTIEVNDGFLHKEAHRATFTLIGSEFVADYR